MVYLAEFTFAQRGAHVRHIPHGDLAIDEAGNHHIRALRIEAEAENVGGRLEYELRRNEIGERPNENVRLGDL